MESHRPLDRSRSLRPGKRNSFRKRHGNKFLKALSRSDAGRSSVSKDESDSSRHVSPSSTFNSESANILGGSQDKMGFFKQDEFDLDAFVEAHMANLSEKGLLKLKNELVSSQEKVETEAQMAIHGSYALFVDACDGVAEVESQFQHLRVLVAGTTTLANELKRAIQNSAIRHGPDATEGGLTMTHLSKELSNTLNIRTLTVLEELDVAIAERDFQVAKKLLVESDGEIDEIGGARSILSLECSVDERRQIIVQLLENQLQDPTLGPHDQHALLQILASVAGEVHALDYLLALHTAQISKAFQKLPKPHRTGESENEGAEYSGSLSQSCFHGIGLAVEDFHSVFGNTAAAPLCSILAQWADSETKKCAETIHSHALSAFSGLSAMVQCIAMTLIYAQCLKTSHSINLTPVIQKVFWPTLETSIQKYFATVGDEVLISVHEEMSVLLTTSSPWDRHGQASLDGAQMIVDRVRYLNTVLRPLWTFQVAKAIRNGLKSTLDIFIDALAVDIQEKAADEGTLSITDRMLEWAMTIIANLVEDRIPKELAPLENKVGVILTKIDIQKIVEKAAQNFGMESAFLAESTRDF